MSHYSASVRVDDGMLHTSRPLTAPDEVRDVVDTVVYAVTDSGGRVTAVELEFETPDESDTPLADSISGTSSTPLPSAGAAAGSPDVDEDGA